MWRPVERQIERKRGKRGRGIYKYIYMTSLCEKILGRQRKWNRLNRIRLIGIDGKRTRQCHRKTVFDVIWFVDLFMLLFFPPISSPSYPPPSKGPRLQLSILTRNVALSADENELHPWMCGLLFLQTNWCHDKFRQG
jgi:hypothetical protein